MNGKSSIHFWLDRIVTVCAVLFLGAANSSAKLISLDGAAVSASTTNNGSAIGVIDRDRFSSDAGHAWRGTTNATDWWWQIRFDAPKEIGAILQIVGDHSFVLRDAPRDFVWQWSMDGRQWNDLSSTRTVGEQRAFRLHRLRNPQRATFLRLQITAASGAFPTLREVEFFSNPDDAVPFPDWIVAVNTTEKPDLPGHGREFIPLARSSPGWDHLQAQQVWLGTFDEGFVSAEPRPLCAFLSGNFKDWCEISRGPWRGTQAILQKKNLPIWASCGGAQGLAILADTGVDHPWDCPHCRDPLAPKTPIYGHIGHTNSTGAGLKCGDYSACIFERGPHRIKQVIKDPVFRGLPEEFTAIESHCGQIEYPPRGWELIATAGEGTKTKTQCIHLKGTLIYAAQFHIEMEGSPETSRKIMANFLDLARNWKNRPWSK